MVIQVLYTLKSAGKSFHKHIAKRVHGLGFNPSMDDTYTWMKPVVKPFGSKYYVCMILRKDDSTRTRDNQEKFIKGLESINALQGIKGFLEGCLILRTVLRSF